MQWNKFKKKVKEYIHPLFRDKIKFNYNGGWSNKFIILYENKALATYISDPWNWEANNLFTPVIPDEFGEALKIMHQMMEEEAVKQKTYSPQKVSNLIMDVFNNMSIKDALNSENKFIRAIALIDRRCGSRTFKQIDYSTEEDFLLRNVYNLRKYLEGQK